MQYLAELHEGLGGVGSEDFGLDVLIGAAAAVQAFNQPDAVAEHCGFLVLERLGGLGHLLSELAENHRAFGPQESYKVAYNEFFVLGFFDFGGAGSGALLDTVQNAGAKEPAFRVVFADVQLAGSELEDFLQDYEHLSEVFGPGEGSEQPASAMAGLAGDIDPRKIVAGGDFEVGKCLVVHEVGVVRRPDVLDQAGLLEHRIDF